MSGSDSVEIQSAIEARLKRLSDTFVDQYGEDLSDLRLSVVDGRFTVAGSVIVPKQLLALRRAFHDWPPETHRCAGCRGEFDPPSIEVAVLSQLDSSELQAESQAHTLVVDHPSDGPVSVFSRRREGELVTEWLPGDGPARQLRGPQPPASSEGQSVAVSPRSLLQLVDGTVGWCDVSSVRARPPSDSDLPIVRALSVGTQVEVSAGQIERLLHAVDDVADAEVAYRLGGRDWGTGVDCSALVQRLVESCMGALLPRHSGDQMKVGQRVPRTELRPADLLFARALDRKILHVGIILRDDQIGHACRLDGRVKREPIDEFLERYRFLRGQRVFSQAEPGKETTT